MSFFSQTAAPPFFAETKSLSPRQCKISPGFRECYSHLKMKWFSPPFSGTSQPWLHSNTTWAVSQNAYVRPYTNKMSIFGISYTNKMSISGISMFFTPAR